MTEDPGALTLQDFAGALAGRDVRAALMWPPTARDLDRILAAAFTLSPRPHLVDVGAGSGLLTALLAPHLQVTAVDPGDGGIPTRRIARFFPVVYGKLEDVKLDAAADVALVSWMEAGSDYRDAVAALAPVVVQAYDPAGGCGVLGDVAYDRHGYHIAARWTTPSWEDVAHALRTRGRGAHGSPLPRQESPGNCVEVLTRDPGLLPPLRAAVGAAPSRVAELPWEAEMRGLGLTSGQP